MKDNNKTTTTTTTTTETQDMGLSYDDYIETILNDTLEEPDGDVVDFDY